MIEEEKERSIDECLRKTREEAERKNAHLLLEQEIARVEAEQAREIYHEKKMRQQIRENNQELRILESKLRTAYVSKALASQKKEHEALALAEKIQQKQENYELEMERLEHLEKIKKDQEADRERKKKLHEDLKNQIIAAHQQQQRLYEEFLREKYYLDEIAKRLKDELMEQAQQKIIRKEQTKKEMDAFKIIKQEFEKIQQIETAEENQRILDYCQQRDTKIQEEEKRRKELEMNRKNLNEKMVAELTELEVSLSILYFISEGGEKSVNMFAIGKARPKAFQQHRLLLHRLRVISIRDDPILVQVHLFDNYIHQIFHGFISQFLFLLVNGFLHKINHLLSTNLIFATHVVHFKAIQDFLRQ